MYPKALVVDDNFYNRDLARLALDNVGFEVSEAENGRDALTKLQHDNFDLMVLDLAMPELDGVGVITEVRRHTRHNQMKIVVVTANAHMADSIEREADFVMYKPIDIAQFVTFLRRLKSAAV